MKTEVLSCICSIVSLVISIFTLLIAITQIIIPLRETKRNDLNYLKTFFEIYSSESFLTYSIFFCENFKSNFSKWRFLYKKLFKNSSLEYKAFKSEEDEILLRINKPDSNHCVVPLPRINMSLVKIIDDKIFKLSFKNKLKLLFNRLYKRN